MSLNGSNEASQDAVVEMGAIEQLEYFEGQMMAFLVQDFEGSKAFLTSLSGDYFRNENYVLYKMFSTMKVEGVKIDEVHLKLYLKAHRFDIEMDTDRIAFNLFATSGDVSALDSFMVAVVERYREYSRLGYITEASIQSAFSRYKDVYARLQLQDIFVEAGQALNSPVLYNRRYYKGSEGSLDFALTKLNKLRGMFEEDESFELTDTSELDISTLRERKYTQLARIPTMPTLDSAIGGLKTNTFTVFVAPEKGMKTKTACMMTHLVMLNGHNCSFWGKEGGSLKIVCELRAIHFDYYYNKKRGKNYVQISGQQIMEDNFPSDEFRKLEEISFNDLFKSGRYGKLYTPEHPFEYEQLETVIKSAVAVGCKFHVIDYIQILESRTIKDPRVLIKTAVGRIESLKGKYDIHIWLPAQMSTDAIQTMAQGKKRELRNVVAESTDITKSADVNLMLYVNDDMAKNNVARMIALPSRTFGGFPDIDVRTNKVVDSLVELKGQGFEIDEDGEMVLTQKGE